VGGGGSGGRVGGASNGVCDSAAGGGADVGEGVGKGAGNREGDSDGIGGGADVGDGDGGEVVLVMGRTTTGMVGESSSLSTSGIALTLYTTVAGRLLSPIALEGVLALWGGGGGG
jgi:hypothetical protein